MTTQHTHESLMRIAANWAEACMSGDKSARLHWHDTLQTAIAEVIQAKDDAKAKVTELEAEVKRLTQRLKITSDTMNGYMLKRDTLQARLNAIEGKKPFGWVKQSEIDTSKQHGGSINLWRKQYDCDTAVYLAPTATESAGKVEALQWCDQCGEGMVAGLPCRAKSKPADCKFAAKNGIGLGE